MCGTIQISVRISAAWFPLPVCGAGGWCITVGRLVYEDTSDFGDYY